MSRVTRRPEIDKKRRRKAKIKKIKTKIAKAKDSTQVQKLVEKIYRIHPFYPMQSK